MVKTGISEDKAGALHIGTSGYQYRHWQGPFYPSDLPKRRWLAHYAAAFDTVHMKKLKDAHTPRALGGHAVRNAAELSRYLEQ